MSENEIVESRPLTPAASFDLSPKSMDEALRFADKLAESNLVPKDFIGKPGNILVAIQWGMELGLKPMQAMQNIAVINGRPSLWGDAVLALVLASPLCEYVDEWEEGGTAFCKVKRRGKPEDIQSFGEEDARQAGLLNKQGPWTQYPKRMKKMRARSFAVRDNFADVLKGIHVAEEVMDIEVVNAPSSAGRRSPTQIAQNAAESARPPRTQRHEEIIKNLETVAKEWGFEPFKEEWSKLARDDRAAIGLSERDRISALAQSSTVESSAAQPAAGAGDE